jgi:hypothetical protein
MPREDERFDDREDRDRGDDLEIRRQPPSGMDALFLNTNMVLLVIFGLCCGIVALIIGVVGLATCKHPDAKQRAMVVTIISGIMTVWESWQTSAAWHPPRCAERLLLPGTGVR